MTRPAAHPFRRLRNRAGHSALRRSVLEPGGQGPAQHGRLGTGRRRAEGRLQLVVVLVVEQLGVELRRFVVGRASGSSGSSGISSSSGSGGSSSGSSGSPGASSGGLTVDAGGTSPVDSGTGGLPDTGAPTQGGNPPAQGPLGSCTNPACGTDSTECGCQATDSAGNTVQLGCESGGQCGCFVNGNLYTDAFDENGACNDPASTQQQFLAYCSCQ